MLATLSRDVLTRVLPCYSMRDFCVGPLWSLWKKCQTELDRNPGIRLLSRLPVFYGLFFQFIFVVDAFAAFSVVSRQELIQFT